MAQEILSQSDNWFSFHLLSEGDAGVLGKFNAHYSNDILAHLIGEPISGNCYMWSAPNQPFVLPVRIRSFEELYGKEIRADVNEQKVEGTLAEQIYQEVSESLKRLKKDLIEALKSPKTKFVPITAEDEAREEYVGIKSGQLFYIIRDLKTEADTQSENYLKEKLLNLILGEGTLRIMKRNGDEFFCAKIDAWREGLGETPKC
jgi:hypothetical protein